ncbi:MAG: PKD domain-containing protein [Myxococcota bacterium]
MNLKTLSRGVAFFGCAAFAGAIAACDAGGADVSTPGPDPSPGTTTLAISFTPMGPTETRCGNAAGVHVQISDGNGDVQTCDAEWAPAEKGGQPVADCFFVVHPGTWKVDDVSVIDSNEQALSCCDGSWPDSVSVAESETTEFGAAFTCDTVSNGALDIFATVNRPPTITNITISPSKFGNTCSLITLGAQGTDPDGDDVSFTWAVESGPTAGDWALVGRGATAYFLGASQGDYSIRLTATDDYGASHHLDFPLHLTGGGTCEARATLEPLLP